MSQETGLQTTNGQRPILSDTLKTQFEGAAPEVKIIDGNVGSNGKATYLMVPRILEGAFAHGVPTVDSPEFGINLRPQQRAKLIRSVRRAQKFPAHIGPINTSGLREGIVRAAETRAALADNAVIIAQKRAEAEAAGKDKTSLRKQASTMVPWLQSEILIHDPVTQFDNFLNKEKKGDKEYVESILTEAVETLVDEKSIKPPHWAMDGLSFISGWLTAPIDWNKARKSWHDRVIDMDSTKMYMSTAVIDLWPHPTPGISSSHARWATNTHKLLEEAIQINNLYEHLVQGHEVNTNIPRSKLYAEVSKNMLANLNVEDPSFYINIYRRIAIPVGNKTPLEKMHENTIRKANQIRNELGQSRGERNQNKDRYLTTADLHAYQERANTPEQFYRLLTYTMGAKLESALDVVNNSLPLEQQVHYK